MPSLQGEDYLNQEPQQGAYGTPSNPAQAPTVQGGWGGILLSGATALAGIATDNPYAVGFGSDMGQSYHDSYDTLNKSLIDEQRANRLADSSLARQKNLSQYERDLTQGDRDQAQANADRQFGLQESEFGLRESESEERAKTGALSRELTGLQIAEAKKTPKQRAEEAAEAQRILLTMQAEVTANQTTAANNAQIANLTKTLTDIGVSDEVKTQAVLQLRLKQAGIEMKKNAAKAFSGPEKVKLQQVGADEFKERDEYTAISKEQSQEAADKAAAAYGIQYANAVESQLSTTTTGLAATILADIQGGGDGGGGGGSESGMGKAISAFYKGEFTAEQLLAGADTPEEKAAAQEAINLATQEDADPGSAAGMSERLGAQAEAEKQSALQGRYDEAPSAISQQAVLNQAQGQGVEIDKGETGFSMTQERTIGRYVDRFTAADAAGQKKLIDKLRKNAPPELLEEVLRRVK